jgi:ABC-type antimicrobial peptide transport system permease subunit
VASVFSGVSLVTAAAGLVSVLAYTVSRRRREFGIRTALGASAGQLQWLVIRDGCVVVGAGTVLGGVGGLVVARALAAFQYGVSAADPMTWGTVIAVLAATSLAAAWYPARLALRSNPSTLLREP